MFLYGVAINKFTKNVSKLFRNTKFPYLILTVHGSFEVKFTPCAILMYWKY